MTPAGIEPATFRFVAQNTCSTQEEKGNDVSVAWHLHLGDHKGDSSREEDSIKTVFRYMDFQERL